MRVTGKMANPKAWVNKLSKMETKASSPKER